MVEVMQSALAQVSSFPTLLVILFSAIYGILVGAIPGLTATMAVTLIVPLTFFLTDVQAIAAIVTTVTCSIFAGDIPGTLVRIPGTPASAAYAADGYALTQQGRYLEALKTSLTFSIVGGLLGTVVLIVAAPQLASVAAQFTSYEYFWLYVLGLTCAVIVSDESRLKGLFSLLLGLLLSAVGLATDYSEPRLTFGIDELINGVNFIPAMIGLFGLSEVLRLVIRSENKQTADSKYQEAQLAMNEVKVSIVTEAADCHGEWLRIWNRKFAILRSSSIGAIVGMLPGAGADIAAWISYAVSKRFSRQPELYGRGSIEGISDATGANNAALGGAWIPALVFGIPGDSVTAIALGILMMKNITPGPNIFDMSSNSAQAVLVMSIYITFILANLLLIPIGLAAIRASSMLVKIPTNILLPFIVLFSVIGSYALASSYVDIWIMVALGVLGFTLERFRFPLGPVVLGIIMGAPLEHRLLQCLSKSTNLQSFVGSQLSMALAGICFVLWVFPIASNAISHRARSRI
ncbi:MAG: tripartite tricarboxylate transporter permease [Planctomycetales bacterium]|nr:tripartite tricarboxylate transporter permease [Planctomycetales bacterium]